METLPTLNINTNLNYEIKATFYTGEFSKNSVLSDFLKSTRNLRTNNVKILEIIIQYFTKMNQIIKCLHVMKGVLH